MPKQKGISKQQLNKMMKTLPVPLQEHAKRVKLLVTFVLEKVKTEDWFMDLELNEANVISAAFYHDIGKKSLPKDNYYLAHSRTIAARDKYYTHVEEGVSLLEKTFGIRFSDFKENSLESYVYQAITEHHECFDGSGYPNKKAGKGLSFIGKLVAVADKLDNILFVGNSGDANDVQFDIAIQELKGFVEKKKLDPFVVRLFTSDLDTLENYVQFINTAEQQKRKRDKYGIVLRYQIITNIRENEKAFLKFDFALNDQYYGIVEPGAFMGISEKTGQVTILEKIALERLCQTIKRYEKRGLKMPKLLITVSHRTFEKKNYFKDITKILERNEVKGNQFAFAVREGVVSEIMDKLPNIVNNYHLLGSEFYIDEFGEQTSAITELENTHIDGVIVREDFANKILSNPKIYNVINGMVKIALSLNLNVVYGGVENSSCEEELLKMGVKYAYGPFYSKKLITKELFRAWLREGGAK